MLFGRSMAACELMNVFDMLPKIVAVNGPPAPVTIATNEPTMIRSQSKAVA